LTGCGIEVEKIDNTAEQTTEAAAVGTTAETIIESESQSEIAADTAVPEITPTTEAETAAVTQTEPPTEPATVVQETTAASPNEIFALNGPLGRHQGVEEFDNAKFAASFGAGDFTKNADNTFTLTTMIYRYEMFSSEDIQSLKVGDTIWCLGKNVAVDTIEVRDSGLIIVNGGIENGGRYFKTDVNGLYFESGMNDRHSYYEIGENTYTLSADFVFTDNSDMDNPKTYTAEEFMSLLTYDTHFVNSNTIVETSNGVVTAIVRNYIP
jgi:hypothetical protein